MAGRPCNPNSDLKRLWQLLLPLAPFPQCGTAPAIGATNRDQARLAKEQSADAEQPTPADPDA
jgi:hypothetical protein